MKLHTIIATAVMLGITSWSQYANSGDLNTLQEISRILLKLNHYPTAQEKKLLRDIRLNALNSDQERIIANAILNLEHRIDNADKPRIQAVINNKQTSQAERRLATIILNLDHRPSAKDRKVLKAILKSSQMQQSRINPAHR